MYIDFHTHTFPDKIALKTVTHLAGISRTVPFTNGSADGLSESMIQANMDYSVNLPVMTSVSQVEKVNRSLIRSKEILKEKHIITFGGMHPDYENYKEELKFLKDNGIAGIKIHPAYQNTDLDDIRFMRIIDAASELGLIVTTHAGIDIGILDHNYASVKMALHVIDTVKPEKLVLAHMGGWGDWDSVRSDLAGAPVYFDSAFSLGPITPLPTATELPYRTYNLTSEEFMTLFRSHGAEKVLFATDSPWGDQSDGISQVEALPLTLEEKALFTSENAMRLLAE